jgi:hypothetical protein
MPCASRLGNTRRRKPGEINSQNRNSSPVPLTKAIMKSRLLTLGYPENRMGKYFYICVARLKNKKRIQVLHDGKIWKAPETATAKPSHETSPFVLPAAFGRLHRCSGQGSRYSPADSIPVLCTAGTPISGGSGAFFAVSRSRCASRQSSATSFAWRCVPVFASNVLS